jgi:16S rRNA (guanine527-N7)-methyltransferase
MLAPYIVSRETQDRLSILCDMVERWNKAINLVSTASLADLRGRHLADSVQLMQFLPQTARHWVDLGSGGGFPGLVVAACLADTLPHCGLTMIESDQRKAVFLREASRAMALKTQVIAARIQDVVPQDADVLSARALASLPVLLTYALPHLRADGAAIFPKGQGHESEIAEARRAGWNFTDTRHTSATDASGTILILRKIIRDPAD